MVKKLFTKTYDELIQQASVFHMEFVKFKDEFTAFSSIFEDPFAENFLNLINQARTFISMEYYDNDSKVLFLQLQEYLHESRNVYKKLLAYLNLIYPNSEAVMNAFGKNKYNVNRRTPVRMKETLQLAHKNANSEPYKSELIAVGFSQSNIDELLETANHLDELFLEHQEFIQNSFNTTDERINLHNQVWLEMTKISRASKFIFASSPAKIWFFQLYRGTKSKKSSEE